MLYSKHTVSATSQHGSCDVWSLSHNTDSSTVCNLNKETMLSLSVGFLMYSEKLQEPAI